MKVCSKCGEAKPPSEFHRDRDKRDGRTSQCKACRVPTNAAWKRANPIPLAESKQQHRELHPEKHRARRVIDNAVQRGTIRKPNACEGCGQKTSRGDLHAHHKDYSKPRQVEWLCRGCHSNAEAEDG